MNETKQGKKSMMIMLKNGIYIILALAISSQAALKTAPLSWADVRHRRVSDGLKPCKPRSIEYAIEKLKLFGCTKKTKTTKNER